MHHCFERGYSSRSPILGLKRPHCHKQWSRVDLECTASPLEPCRRENLDESLVLDSGSGMHPRLDICTTKEERRSQLRSCVVVRKGLQVVQLRLGIRRQRELLVRLSPSWI